MKKGPGVLLACLLVLALSLCGCAAPDGTKKGTASPEQEKIEAVQMPSVPLPDEPYWPTKGWRVSPPEAHGMDSAKIAEFIHAAKGEEAYQSFLLIRDGYIAAECYFGKRGEGVTRPVIP